YGPHPESHSFPTRRSSDLHLGEPHGTWQVREAHRHFMLQAPTQCLPLWTELCERKERGLLRRVNGIHHQRNRRLHAWIRSKCNRSEEHTSELQSRENLVCR